MAQWGSRHRVVFVGQEAENRPQLPLTIVEEDLKDDKSIIAESLAIPEFKKRKRLCRSRYREVRETLHVKQEVKALPVKQEVNAAVHVKQEVEAEFHGKQGPSNYHSSSNNTKRKNKHETSVDRWSVERYRVAEKNMLDVMKAEGATFTNPIPRHELRAAARKHIGDTGLLDHLLKHIDRKVAPGGTDRFRRWFNAQGIMEYWLESADLENIRQEAGVEDPFWVPHSKLVSPNGTTEDLKLLKAEMAIMKRDMQELASKKQEEDQVNSVEMMHKELLKWKTETEGRWNEITSCLKGMQGMLSGEWTTWKAKVDQQLFEITNSLTWMQASKELMKSSSPPASDRWEDWLESTKLDNMQEDDLVPWLESTNLVNNTDHNEVLMQGFFLEPPLRLNCDTNPTQAPDSATEQEPNDMSRTKRDLHEPLSEKQVDDEANVTPDSCATFNSKSDLDTSILSFQEMFRELFNWKAKTEQQLTEISNSLHGLKA